MSELGPRSQSDPTSGSADESVHSATIRDQPTADDFLGFQPYVQAIAQFLTNPDTEPPLTLSIEGDWGSGKSSFMKQLKKELKARAHSNTFIVDFNAWRHDKEEALWASFALAFTRKLSEQLHWTSRCLAYVKLFNQRFNWQEGWVDAFRALAVGLIFIAATVAILVFLFAEGLGWTQTFVDQVTMVEVWQDLLKGGIASGGIAAYVAVVVTLWSKLSSLIGNPLAIHLQRYAKFPDYESRVAFVEQFHEDFEKIVQAYAGRDSKVYVFIDDVDRCEVPKSAELMQALNLMLSDSGQLIYIIGMDREQVAAGYAVKQSALLPFLAPTSTPPGTPIANSFDPVAGLEYGYEFIEKFIQLPFNVPQPTKDDVKRLLYSLSTDRDTAQTNVTRGTESSQELVNSQNSDRTGAVNALGRRDDPSLEEPREVRKRINLGVTRRDSDAIRDIVLLVSPALNYNPRRILHFINLFRLRIFIGYNTTLFDEIEGSAEDALTLEQLGKFVAISLRWPLLLSDLELYPTLLSRLQAMVLDNEEWERIQTGEDLSAEEERAVVRWGRQQHLLELLRAGFVDISGSVDKEMERKYSLAKLNVRKLLQVSPLTRPSSTQSHKSSRLAVMLSIENFVWRTDDADALEYSFTLSIYNHELYPVDIHNIEVIFLLKSEIVGRDRPNPQLSIRLAEDRVYVLPLATGDIVYRPEEMHKAMRCDRAQCIVLCTSMTAEEEVRVDLPIPQGTSNK